MLLYVISYAFSSYEISAAPRMCRNLQRDTYIF